MPAAQHPTISDKAVVGILFQELETARQASWVDRIANRFNSNQATETYAGVGNAPPMTEWLGQKKWHELKPFSHTITNLVRE